MRILCVNHTGAISGAEHSLLDLLRGLRARADVTLACPPHGPLTAAARDLGVEVTPIIGTDGSLRLDLVETPKAVVQLGAGAVTTARAAVRARADVVHANSIRAGLFAAPAARLIRRPSVVHLRDRLPRSKAADVSLRLIGRAATTVVANSAFTAAGMTAVTCAAVPRVVYNPVDLSRFSPSVTRGEWLRQELGLPNDRLVFGVVGQITPWKGQLEAIRAFATATRAGLDARLVIVGETRFLSGATRYDNVAYDRQLHETVTAAGLDPRVSFVGHRDDMPDVMSSLDVLLVPSWEEPFGRVVVEAMALGKAVIATAVGGPREIISDGVDGLLAAPQIEAQWAEAITALAASPERRAALGRAARSRAAAFDTGHHVDKMFHIYAEVVGSAVTNAGGDRLRRDGVQLDTHADAGDGSDTLGR